jgi:hypothetical protein
LVQFPDFKAKSIHFGKNSAKNDQILQQNYQNGPKKKLKNCIIIVTGILLLVQHIQPEDSLEKKRQLQQESCDRSVMVSHERQAVIWQSC